MFAPNQSLNSSAVRSNGKCWRAIRYIASARTRGPYCVGAATPPGNAALVSFPQQHRRRSAMCSTTRRRISGRSNTCRRSRPSTGAWRRSPPQQTHDPGAASQPRPDRRPPPGAHPRDQAGHRLASRRRRSSSSPAAWQAHLTTAAATSCANSKPAAAQISDIALQPNDPQLKPLNRRRLLNNQRPQLLIRRPPKDT